MRFRFSLKTLFILITLVCVFLGTLTNEVIRLYFAAERHREALAVFSDGQHFLHDGYVDFRDGRWMNAPPSNSLWVDFARQRIHPLAYVSLNKVYVTSGWTSVHLKLKELRNLSGLHELTANLDSFTKEDAATILAIPNLKECIFGATGPVEPGAMAILARDPRLTKFILHPVDAETCFAISKNRSLIEVGVGGEGFNAADMRTICQSRSIEKLILINTDATRQMLEPLSQMPQLKEIELNDAIFEEEAVDELSKLHITSIAIHARKERLKSPISRLADAPELRRLLSSSPLPREEGDVASFAKCLTLEELLLTECVIDAESLRALSKLTALKKAAFSGDLPDEAAQEFVDALPGRELTIYPKGLWHSHTPQTAPKTYISTNTAGP